MSVGSEPATSGSVMAKHDRAVPSHSGRRYLSFCSGVPQCSRVCWLPSSGAWALMTNGPMPTLAASADTAAIAVGPSPIPPHSGGMCGNQIPQSSRAILRSFTIVFTTSLRCDWSVASTPAGRHRPSGSGPSGGSPPPREGT